MSGLELKLARVRFGLTQWAFAREVGVSAQRLSEMERGQRRVPDEVGERIRELEAVTLGAVDA